MPVTRPAFPVSTVSLCLSQPSLRRPHVLRAHVPVPDLQQRGVSGAPVRSPGPAVCQAQLLLCPREHQAQLDPHEPDDGEWGPCSSISRLVALGICWVLMFQAGPSMPGLPIEMEGQWRHPKALQLPGLPHALRQTCTGTLWAHHRHENWSWIWHPMLAWLM